jgi:hypothetical protein
MSAQALNHVGISTSISRVALHLNWHKVTVGLGHRKTPEGVADFPLKRRVAW